MTILSKQFPMDLGTGSIEQVRQSAPKIDMELGAIYGHLNNIRTRYRGATPPSNPETGMQWDDSANDKVMVWNGSTWVEDVAKSMNLTNRNTVLQGVVSSTGVLGLIAGSTTALTADLVATTDTIIAIPAGHDANTGNVDYIVSFTATQTDFWSSLPATNTSYLFVDYSSGTVTGTYSVIAPVYQSYAPAHSAGKNWYDTNKEQWYLSDGSNWVAKYRCYVGYVVTDGTKVTATTIEPYLKLRGNLLGNLTGNVTGNLTGNVTTPDGALSPFLGGYKNKLINGNFSINQRAVSGTVTLSAGQYGHDRWKAGSSGCTYTFATVENVTTITISAGSLLQIIEGSGLMSGTHVLSWQGTAQGKIGAGSYGASGITATVTGGTNLNIEFGTGTLKLVQFEQGSIATPFESRHIGQELALCERYTWILRGVNKTLASATVGTYSDANTVEMVNLWASKIESMRKFPTFTQVGTQGTDWAVITSGGVAQTGFTLTALTPVVVGCAKTSHGISNTASLLLLTANGAFVFDAEL